MSRKYPDMLKLKIGSRIKFRNGGVSTVSLIEDYPSSFYPIGIRLKTFHAFSEEAWCYDEKGFCGNGTGPGRQCTFDIMEILK